MANKEVRYANDKLNVIVPAVDWNALNKKVEMLEMERKSYDYVLNFFLPEKKYYFETALERERYIKMVNKSIERISFRITDKATSDYLIKRFNKNIEDIFEVYKSEAKKEWERIEENQSSLSKYDSNLRNECYSMIYRINRIPIFIRWFMGAKKTIKFLESIIKKSYERGRSSL